MRVLHVIGRLGQGGDSVAVYSVSHQLKEAGCQFDYVTHEGYNEIFADRVRSEGSNVYVLKGDVRKLGIFGYYKELKKILESTDKYDAIHVHTSMQSGVALSVANKLKIPNRICHVHTNSIQRPTSKLKKILLVPLFKALIKRYATQRVACGVDAGKFIYGESDEFTVIKNGLNVEKFLNVKKDKVDELIRELELPGDCFVIGHVGRFSSMKNQQYSLSLIEHLNRKNQNMYLIFVGDGENFENIKKVANSKSANIKFVGKRTDIEVFMKLFDVLLLPSLPGEGLPITLIEAQISGCYCISSDNVTKEADLGIGILDYIPLNEMESWIRKIHELKNAIKPSTMKVKSAIQEKHFDLKQTVLDWKKLYI